MGTNSRQPDVDHKQISDNGNTNAYHACLNEVNKCRAEARHVQPNVKPVADNEVVQSGFPGIALTFHVTKFGLKYPELSASNLSATAKLFELACLNEHKEAKRDHKNVWKAPVVDSVALFEAATFATAAQASERLRAQSIRHDKPKN